MYLGSNQSVAADIVLPYRGCVNDSATGKITKYNCRLSTKFLNNEAIEESTNNNQTPGHVNNAVWSGDKPFFLSKSNATFTATLFENASYDIFMTVANMCYSSEELKNVVQGVSSSTPMELQVTIDTSRAGTIIVNNFCETGNDLVIQNEMIRYVEQKPGSQTVY